MLFPVISLVVLLAAGGDTTPCVKRDSSTVPSNGVGSPIHIVPATSGSSTVLNNGFGRPIHIVPATSGQASSGKCPAGFLNAVFNTGAPKNSGWPNKVWDSLSSNGVTNFIGFSLKPLPQNPHYNTASGPAASYGPLDAAQIPIGMDPTDVAAAKDMISGPNPPAYLELFNEPDYSFAGLTPLTSAPEAATDLAPLINTNTSTKFISPAPAYTSSSYLSDFSKACAGCMDKIGIVAAHVYSVDPQGAIDQIKGLHATWPDKKIWVTELAPASGGAQGCTYDEGGMVTWMQKVVPTLAGLGYVDKVFWNHGEYAVLDQGVNPATCNPSLTNEDGSATALLTAYGALCQ